MRHVDLRLLALAASAIAAPAALAAPCTSITLGAAFSSAYSCNNLGTPTDVTGALGGVTFLDSDTLLIGGNADSSGGVIRMIDVARDAGGHITGFAAPSAAYATAPQIDGGLSFAPNGTLLATGYPNNTLLQYKPGSTSPDLITSLSSFGVSSSVGALAFVPTGFDGAGALKVASYSGGGFYDLAYTIGGDGLYTITGATLTAQINRGPEGIVYVDGMNAGFGVDSILTTDYGNGTVSAYETDSNGNPLVATRRDFLSGLSGAEGAAIDPVTGDFVFSTFSGSNSLYVVSGFVAPPSAVPEPASWAMMIGGFAMVGGALRRRKVAIRFA